MALVVPSLPPLINEEKAIIMTCMTVR